MGRGDAAEGAGLLYGQSLPRGDKKAVQREQREQRKLARQRKVEEKVAEIETRIQSLQAAKDEIERLEEELETDASELEVIAKAIYASRGGKALRTSSTAEFRKFDSQTKQAHFRIVDTYENTWDDSILLTAEELVKGPKKKRAPKKK